MAAARVIDAKYSTLIGTTEQIRDLLGVLAGGGRNGVTGVAVDLKFSNFVILDKPADAKLVAQAIETTPRKQKA